MGETLVAVAVLVVEVVGELFCLSGKVGLLSDTTVCSSSLMLPPRPGGVMEEVMGGLVNCQLPSGLSPSLEGN